MTISGIIVLRMRRMTLLINYHQSLRVPLKLLKRNIVSLKKYVIVKKKERLNSYRMQQEIGLGVDNGKYK